MSADFIFTAGSLVFIAALLPSVFGPNKPALASSLLTGTVLLVFAVTYLTISLPFSAATTAITSSLWFVLAIQARRGSAA